MTLSGSYVWFQNWTIYFKDNFFCNSSILRIKVTIENIALINHKILHMALELSQIDSWLLVGFLSLENIIQERIKVKESSRKAWLKEKRRRE